MNDNEVVISKARAIARTEVKLHPDEATRLRFLLGRESLRQALLRYDALTVSLATALHEVQQGTKAAAALWPSVT